MNFHTCLQCGQLIEAGTKRKFCSKECYNAYRGNSAARFWERVDKSRGPDACWEWLGRRCASGHGTFYVNREEIQAHRFSFWLAHGYLPKYSPEHSGSAKVIMHLCHNPTCVNPAHLAVGTLSENIRQRYERLRRGIRGYKLVWKGNVRKYCRSVFRSCQFCGRPFRARASDVESGYGRYCSKACYYAAHRRGRVCKWCGKILTVTLSQAKGGRGYYCSRECRWAAYHHGEVSFWSKVLKPASEEGCWLWHGAKGPDGYGVVRRGGKQIKAHRYAFWLAHGHIAPYKHSNGSDNLVVCHRCDNPLCVNPAHLFLGTPKDNVQDAVRKGRKIGLRGERCPTRKLTSEQVMEIRRLYADGVFQKDLSRRFGVKQATIADIVNGRTWTDLPVIPRRVTGRLSQEAA